MEIEVYNDANAVAKAAAATVAAEARAAIAERGRFVMAVSGGHTPWLMLRALLYEDVPWEAVHLVQVDERVAPNGDPDRNLAGRIQRDRALIRGSRGGRTRLHKRDKGVSMRIGIATDHGGFGLKEDLLRKLKEADYAVIDCGAHSLESADDYPDFVIPLARSVAAGKVDRGIAVCGSGVGASIAANKIRGARAALILDHFSARQGVEDDHMNIICLGGRVVGPATAWELVKAFLAAEYSQAERHLRRLRKVAQAEMNHS